MSNLRQRLIYLGLVIVAVVVLSAALLLGGANASVTVEWSTASELNTAGFNLYRGDSATGPFTQINTELIPASPDPLVGGSYIYTDTTVSSGRTYFYQLEDVETNGSTSIQGTVEVTADVAFSPWLVGGLALGLIAGTAFLLFKRPAP